MFNISDGEKRYGKRKIVFLQSSILALLLVNVYQFAAGSLQPAAAQQHQPQSQSLSAATILT